MDNDIDLENILTAGEVARKLKVVPRTVYAWIKQGKLKAMNLAGSGEYRINRADLTAFLHASRMSPADLRRAPARNKQRNRGGEAPAHGR